MPCLRSINNTTLTVNLNMGSLIGIDIYLDFHNIKYIKLLSKVKSAPWFHLMAFTSVCMLILHADASRFFRQTWHKQQSTWLSHAPREPKRVILENRWCKTAGTIKWLHSNNTGNVRAAFIVRMSNTQIAMTWSQLHWSWGRDLESKAGIEFDIERGKTTYLNRCIG